MTQPIGVAVLETPARDFIKAARVEGSHDGKKWQQLAAGLPVFRRPEGAVRLHVEFPPGVWEFLRITLDDRRSEAVPFTGAELLGEKIGTPSVPVIARIRSRDESPGFTRLAVFRSVARHQGRQDSDIDLLVEAPEGTSSFGFIRFKQLIEQVLGREIDLVSYGGLKPKLDDDIRSEAVLL